jgi:FlaA1/EpsC-like NDP-sugar epimerase
VNPLSAIKELGRGQKRLIVLTMDATLCILTVLISFYLRLGFWVWPIGTQWLAVVASLIFAVPLFVVSGLYRAIFRYAGWSALMAVARACALYGLVYSLVFTVMGVVGVPRTVGLIQPVLLLLAVGASRALARHWLSDVYSAFWRADQRRNVLIYGAGSAGRQLAAAIATSPDMQHVGYLDDDQTLQGSILNGQTIFAPVSFREVAAKYGVSDILLAMPSVTRRRRNEILDMIRGTHVSVRTLPALTDLARGKVTTSDLRELDIEDLLGRDAVAPNQILLGKTIREKTVLVTGAGGSIGSELCRQILALEPKILLLVEMNEFGLYVIHQELERRKVEDETCDVEIVPLLGSVHDQTRMSSIFGAWKPETVFHAAAYKHVPLVEHNPAEGIRNNVFGTMTTALCAADAGVSDFVLISTDKAVRPTNVMGTSKRLAEMVLQALAARGSATRFSMVRFGNVLGSSGSVVPLFRQQIRAGGPITITHAEMTRYFMTIPEAAQLVIQAGAMAAGGEVFVLDMGDPVRIIDLARNMIELSGLTVRDADSPDGDIEIEVVGLRPGEKLYEELLIGDNPSATTHQRIMKANERHIGWSELQRELAKLKAAMDKSDVPSVRAALQDLVPEFTPDADLVDWIHLRMAAA